MTPVAAGCAAVIAVVFGFAAVGKLRDSGSWTDFVTTTRSMLPTRRLPARPVAVAVVGGEIAAACLAVAAIVTGATLVATLAFAVAAVLLASFVDGIARVLRSGRTVRCRCFGSTGAEFGRTHLVRNGLLLATVVIGLVVTLTGAAAPLGAATFVAAAAGATGGLLVAHWDELTYLVSPSTSAH
jgi:hypothetical protein